MFTINLVTWILLLLSTAGKSQDVPLMGDCKWNNTDGMCILINACPQALSLLQVNDMKSLKSMFCGFEGITGKVCCPIDSGDDHITFNKTEEAKPTEIPSTTATIPWTILPVVSALPTLPALSTATMKTTTTAPTIPNNLPISHSQRPLVNEKEETGKSKIDLRPHSLADTATTFEIINELNYTNEIASTPQPLNILPDRNVCGLFTDTDRILGGDIAAIDEFPWLVRIKYKIGQKEAYACAGSLITNRYVLTAAHCVHNQHIVELRLGEWDADSEKDCYDGICSDTPVDVKIDKTIIYPEYNRSVLLHDIALLRMERSVTITDFIRPVCLPNTDYVAKQDYIPEDGYMVAGWGKTEFGSASSIKRKLRVKAVPISTCQLSNTVLTHDKIPYIICAGGRRGQDSCAGDSGGSLVKQVMENYSSNWFLYGITSYGPRICGSEGHPGHYTRITSYMDWILQNITE